MSNNTTVPTPANPAGWKFETRQIHAGQAPDAATGARALPIYQTTSFVFDSAEQAANRFALAELGPIYTRLNNPTQEVIENRIASLEGGVGALLLASGQAAITYAILNIAGAGDHVVASPSVYGGTYNLLKYTLADLGIETTFVENPDNLDEWRAAVRPNTKLFYGESVPNPRNDVLDIEPIAAIAHENGVPLIVDNTVPTPYLPGQGLRVRREPLLHPEGARFAVARHRCRHLADQRLQHRHRPGDPLPAHRAPHRERHQGCPLARSQPAGRPCHLGWLGILSLV